MDDTDHQPQPPIVPAVEPDADPSVRLPADGEVLEPPAVRCGGGEEPGFSGAEMVREAASPAEDAAAAPAGIGKSPMEDESTDVVEQAPVRDGREIKGLDGGVVEAPARVSDGAAEVEGRVLDDDSGEARVSEMVEDAAVEGLSDAPEALNVDSDEAQGSGLEDVNPASSLHLAVDSAVEQLKDVNTASSPPPAMDANGEHLDDVIPTSSPPPAMDATGEHLDDVKPASSPTPAMDATIEHLGDVKPASSPTPAVDEAMEHLKNVNPVSSPPCAVDSTMEHLDDAKTASSPPTVYADQQKLEDVNPASSSPSAMDASAKHMDDVNPGILFPPAVDAVVEQLEDVSRVSPREDSLIEASTDVDSASVKSVTLEANLDGQPASSSLHLHDEVLPDDVGEPANDEDGDLMSGDGDGLKEDVENVNELGIDNDEADDGLKEGAENADELVENDEADDAEVMMDAEDVVKEEDESAPSEAGSSAVAKRKRGRPPKGQSPAQAKAKVQTKSVSKKKDKEEEDVCFICFDGGELVLCDKRGCPKAYHPACVSRDEKFFQSKGKWTCGWHICNHCDKAAQYMCFTCTFSLCKGCQKQSVFLCVRGFRGFCEICMGTVLQIEFNQPENEELAAVDFDDKNNWEYLFKEYWLGVKKRLSITSKELTKAKNSLESVVPSHNEGSSDELYDATKDPGITSDSSSEHVEDIKPAKKKPKKRSRSASKDETKDETSPSSARAKLVNSGKKMLPENAQWASKELLEFVSHMRDGDISVLSPFDVQPLLLEYIKRHKLRDPRRKSQIICDTRLKNLFGKVRVGHFEMLKLLELHFLSKEEPFQGGESVGGMTDTSISQMDVDDDFNNAKNSSDKKRKKGKKAGGKGSANLEEYAAIDVHNVNLIYLRRNLMEALLDDLKNFESKVVGSFVRIRMSGSGQKQDMYRLVQVLGTSKAAEPYKTGRRNTEITLEILNLDKTEIVSIDSISNQDFSEEECTRLRQSIKCGLIRRLSVGEVLEKAKDLQTVRVNDWLETETSRFSHLRDRASEKGRRKELRECVEKLQLLATPEERARRLKEMPEIHADPNMDPSHESDEENEEDRKNVERLRPRGSSYGRNRDRELQFQGSKKSTWDSSGSASSKGTLDKGDFISSSSDRTNESSWNQGRGVSSYNRRGNISSKGSSDKGDFISGTSSDRTNESSWNQGRVGSNYYQQNSQGSNSNLEDASVKLDHEKPMLSPISSPAINESEKMWYYQDPSGKTQGPFSLIQLRKWNTNKYFPADLRIWKNSETQDDSILLTDALLGKFHKDRSQREVERTFGKGSSILDVKPNSELGWGGSHNLNQVGQLQNVSNTQVSDQWTAASSHGQPQAVTVRSATSYQGRENIPADNAYRWNSGQNVGSGWISGGSNVSNPTVQLGNDSSREWERQSSFGTPTPTPNPATAGWAGLTANIPANPNMSIGVPQPAWVQQQVSIPQGVTDAFNPPTPTPKQTSGVWDNMPNQSNTILQPSSTMENEPGRLTSNWAQVSQNQGGAASTLPRNDQVGYSLTPTVEPRQQHPGDNRLSPQAIINQANFAGQRTASSESGWPSQNSSQPLGSAVPPAAVFQGMPGAVNSNWSPTVATAKPSRWGPAVPSTQDQNLSSAPSNNWSAPPTPTPNNTGGANVISGSNTSAGGGWGMNQHVDANPRLGGNDSTLPANGGWNSAAQSNSGWGQADNNNGNWGQGNINTGRPGNNNGGWDSAPMDNANAGWGAAAGNSSSGSRGYRQNYNDDRYSSRGDRSYSSGDHGYRNNRQSWNRSNSGGGRGYQNRGICKYFESGRCVKGANCDYTHN